MIKKYVIIAMFFGLVQCSVHMLYSAVVSFCASSYCSIVPHPLLSLYAQKEIVSAVHDHLRDDRDISFIMQHIKSCYPFINTVSIKKQPHGKLWVQINAHEPIGTISGKQMILANGTIDSCRWYKKNALPLRSIQVDPHFGTLAFDDRSIAWMQSIPEYIDDQYTVTWHNPTSIYLDPKSSNIAQIPLHITIDVSWDCLKQLIAYLPAALKQVPSTRYLGTWVADMRFHKQIIMKVGEKRYGTNTS